MEIEWNVKENDLDGMKVYYKEINGLTGYIVDIFNDGLTAQLKIAPEEFILIPTIQLQTMEKEYIVSSSDTQNCFNCDIRIYASSDASIPVYIKHNECIIVCRKCTEEDDIFFLCPDCGEGNRGEICHNCGEKRAR